MKAITPSILWRLRESDGVISIFPLDIGHICVYNGSVKTGSSIEILVQFMIIAYSPANVKHLKGFFHLCCNSFGHRPEPTPPGTLPRTAH